MKTLAISWLNCMCDTFWPVLRLVWPEIMYVSPKDVADFDGRIECENEEFHWNMVYELLEFLDNCGAYQVEELEDFGGDEGLPKEEKAWVRRAIPWDSEARFQNFQTLCQMFSFLIFQHFEGLVEESEEEKPNIRGPELMELLRKFLDDSKEWHLDYYKCPWNSVFVDENNKRCDDSLAKWIIFPEGFSPEDYEESMGSGRRENTGGS